MFRARARLKGQPLNKLIPNMLTLAALCAGLSGIRFALLEKWEWAVACIIVAAFLDNLDGRMARLLGGSTKFGAELDSLSDFISFGVAPPVIVYLWSLQDIGDVGWISVLLFSMCNAMRLARFNSRQGEVLPAWAFNYFTGVSAPVGAGFALLPMMLFFQSGADVFRAPLVTATVLVGTAALMISTIPTFSFKSIKIPHKYVFFAILLVGLFVSLLITHFWATAIVSIVSYFVSIPFSMRSFSRLKREAERIQALGASEGVQDAKILPLQAGEGSPVKEDRP